MDKQVLLSIMIYMRRHGVDDDVIQGVVRYADYDLWLDWEYIYSDNTEMVEAIMK